MKLSEYLDESGETISQFADRLGISHEAVRRYLKGDRRPEWPILAKIAEATEGGVTADDFVETTNGGPAPEGQTPEKEVA